MSSCIETPLWRWNQSKHQIEFDANFVNRTDESDGMIDDATREACRQSPVAKGQCPVRFTIRHLARTTRRAGLCQRVRAA